MFEPDLTEPQKLRLELLRTAMSGGRDVEQALELSQRLERFVWAGGGVPSSGFFVAAPLEPVVVVTAGGPLEPMAGRSDPPLPHDPLSELVRRFAAALLDKLRAAERKYGHDGAWMRSDWRDDLVKHLLAHVRKGDPRDVAAYCAFAWHHGWSLAVPAPAAEGADAAEWVDTNADIDRIHEEVLRVIAAGEPCPDAKALAAATGLGVNRFDAAMDSPFNRWELETGPGGTRLRVKPFGGDWSPWTRWSSGEEPAAPVPEVEAAPAPVPAAEPAAKGAGLPPPYHEKVFAEILGAVTAGRAMPTDAEIAAAIGGPRSAASGALSRLRKDGRIETEWRDGARRCRVREGDVWSPWSGGGDSADHAAPVEPAAADDGAAEPDPEPEPAPRGAAPPPRRGTGHLFVPNRRASGDRDVEPDLRRQIEERVAAGGVTTCPATVVLERTFEPGLGRGEY